MTKNMTLQAAVFSFLMALPVAAPAAGGPAPEVIHLWTNGAPGFEDRKDIPELAVSYKVNHINNPSVTLFLPPKEKATGAAVLVFPGGGNSELGFVPEGIEAGQFFASNGVAAFAVKYRLAGEPGSPYKINIHPRQDGQRAIRLVRSRAAEWGLDPHRIGMVGFSAGGEVVSRCMFSDMEGDTNSPDPIERVSARPDFVVSIYPGGGGIPRNGVAFTNPPPIFLLVADDDVSHASAVVSLLNGYRAARASVEVHIFARGQHAFNMGYRSQLATIRGWPQRMMDWMADNNILNPAFPAKGVK
jgi:acetyl esterase/lipase